MEYDRSVYCDCRVWTSELNCCGVRCNGVYVRVVSLPCTELFDIQDESYRESVLPSRLTSRVAVEAAHPDFWRKYVGLKGSVVGISNFGESAPGPVVMSSFGFSVKNVVAKVLEIIH